MTYLCHCCTIYVPLFLPYNYMACFRCGVMYHITILVCVLLFLPYHHIACCHYGVVYYTTIVVYAPFCHCQRFVSCYHFGEFVPCCHGGYFHCYRYLNMHCVSIAGICNMLPLLGKYAVIIVGDALYYHCGGVCTICHCWGYVLCYYYDLTCCHCGR